MKDFRRGTMLNSWFCLFCVFNLQWMQMSWPQYATLQEQFSSSNNDVNKTETSLFLQCMLSYLNATFTNLEWNISIVNFWGGGLTFVAVSEKAFPNLNFIVHIFTVWFIWNISYFVCFNGFIYVLICFGFVFIYALSTWFLSLWTFEILQCLCCAVAKRKMSVMSSPK